MHNHAGLFIYQKHIIILINYIYWNIFRINFRISWRVRQHHRNNVRWLYLIARLDCFIIDPYRSGIYGILYAITGAVLDPIHQELVNTYGIYSLLNHDTSVFACPLLFLFDYFYIFSSSTVIRY